MDWFNNYKQKVTIEGNTIRDQRINARNTLFNSVFRDAPEYQSVGLGSINNLYDTWIFSQDAYKKAINEKKMELSYNQNLNNFFLGQYVYWNSEIWSIIAADTRPPNRPFATIKKCNNTFQWLDKTKTLQLYPCIIEAVSNKREDEKYLKYLILADGKVIIKVQYNSYTSQIILGQRFLFNSQPYRIAYIDMVSNMINNVGLIEFIANIDTISSNDNLSLSIADYYQNQHNYTLQIINGSQASLQLASTLQLDIQVLDNSFVVPNPTITYISSNPSICTVNSNGLITASALGSATITATFGTISKSIIINAISNFTNNFTIDINGLLAIALSSSQSYTAVYKNNGNVYTDTSTFWWLTGDDGILSTNLATISISSGNSCTVVANKTTTGYVRLYTKNANSVQSYVRLQIKTLW